MNTVKLEAFIGPVGDRTTENIKEVLDLQIIDKSKQLDLLRYKKKKVYKQSII